MFTLSKEEFINRVMTLNSEVFQPTNIKFTDLSQEVDNPHIIDDNFVYEPVVGLTTFQLEFKIDSLDLSIIFGMEVCPVMRMDTTPINLEVESWKDFVIIEAIEDKLIDPP